MVIYFCFTDYAEAFDCVDHNKLDNSERDGCTRPPYLSPEKHVCRSRSNSFSNQFILLNISVEFSVKCSRRESCVYVCHWLSVSLVELLWCI